MKMSEINRCAACVGDLRDACDTVREEHNASWEQRDFRSTDDIANAVSKKAQAVIKLEQLGCISPRVFLGYELEPIPAKPELSTDFS